MRTLLIKTLAFAAILLPLTASAAKYGDFAVGQKFTLKVIKVTSTEKTGYFGTATKAPVPATLPKFKKDALIAFTIGKNGQLTAKGLSIPFAHGKPKENEYNLFKNGTVTVTHNAEITKNAAKKATGGKLSFFINDYSGAEPVFRTVIYQLD
jgi:hypothetical protein